MTEALTIPPSVRSRSRRVRLTSLDASLRASRCKRCGELLIAASKEAAVQRVQERCQSVIRHVAGARSCDEALFLIEGDFRDAAEAVASVYGICGRCVWRLFSKLTGET